MFLEHPVRTHRTLRHTPGRRSALLAGVLLLASQASAVVICQKENHGKPSFKLREACRTDKGETEAPIGTRTTVYHGSSDSQQAISGSDIALPVAGAATSLTFETTAASSDVVIAFSAGCHTNDTTGGGWLDLALVLDGTTVPPTDLPRNGFCIVVGASPEEVEQTNSYTVAVNDVPAGLHSVQALASNVSVTPFAFMGDVSLVVTVHEH